MDKAQLILTTWAKRVGLVFGGMVLMAGAYQSIGLVPVDHAHLTRRRRSSASKCPARKRIIEVPGPERIVEVPGPERLVVPPVCIEALDLAGAEYDALAEYDDTNFIYSQEPTRENRAALEEAVRRKQAADEAAFRAECRSLAGVDPLG